MTRGKCSWLLKCVWFSVACLSVALSVMMPSLLQCCEANSNKSGQAICKQIQFSLRLYASLKVPSSVSLSLHLYAMPVSVRLSAPWKIPHCAEREKDVHSLTWTQPQMQRCIMGALFQYFWSKVFVTEIKASEKESQHSIPYRTARPRYILLPLYPVSMCLSVRACVCTHVVRVLGWRGRSCRPFLILTRCWPPLPHNNAHAPAISSDTKWVIMI